MNVFHDGLQDPSAAATLGHPGVNFDKAWAVIKKNVAALHEKGIDVLAGTDSVPDYAGLSVPFGTSLHDELFYLTEAGLTPAEAIRAAKLMPELAYNFLDRGVVAPGMRADLVHLVPIRSRALMIPGKFRGFGMADWSMGM